ncbi:MAG: OprO/OprP family phosphate-selective porin, partial [Nitrospirota bacterium]|nr:OprO/OprP family phosphate-selective porin [Nitrospirota bacterium]
YSGLYIMGGYTIFEGPVEALGIGTLKVQPVLNYSSYAPDIEGVDPATVITPCVNFYLGENLKVMIDYRTITDKDGAYFASEDDVFEIRTQVLFK